MYTVNQQFPAYFYISLFSVWATKAQNLHMFTAAEKYDAMTGHMQMEIYGGHLAIRYFVPHRTR